MTEIYDWIIANKDSVIKVIEMIVIICVIGVCYPKWCDIWYQFGGNIYTLIHH